VERKYWVAFNEELLGLPCLQARCHILRQCIACQILFPLQGTLFYDMDERYIDEDNEKLVLLPQARDRELEPPCSMHMAPVGPADAFQLDRCHEACP
jgi:hypothetical protein